VSYDKLCTSVKLDNIIMMDNGFLPLKVEPVGSDHVMCEVMSGVELGERKNCNLSGVKVDLPVLQEKNINDLVNFGTPQPQGVDFVAASFVQSAARRRRDPGHRRCCASRHADVQGRCYHGQRDGSRE